MESSNIKPLESCPMCDKDTIIATYEENERYKYKCNNCGQYFEFNAPSQFAADIIFNEVIRGRIDHPTEKGDGWTDKWRTTRSFSTPPGWLEKGVLDESDFAEDQSGIDANSDTTEPIEEEIQ